jgi:hypothetical protein
MASIKISALGELELDRLSDADVFIVNDQDATTQKITFKTVKDGLDRDARYFTGPVEFGNTVVFNGPLAGRNVYTKDETLNEINLALQPVKDDVDALEAQQVKITDNLGTTASTYITNELAGAVLSAGPKTVKSALSALGLAHDAHTVLIDAVELLVDANASAIAVNAATNDTQDDRLDVLEAAVGLPGDTIGDNTTAITDNAGNIGALYNLIAGGQVAVGGQLISVGTITGGIVEASGNDYTVVAALGALESNLVTANANIVTLTDNATAAGLVADAHQNRINAIQQSLITACTGSHADADALAAAILAAMNALTPLA